MRSQAGLEDFAMSTRHPAPPQSRLRPPDPDGARNKNKAMERITLLRYYIIHHYANGVFAISLPLGPP